MTDVLDELYHRFVPVTDFPGPEYAWALEAWERALAEQDELDLRDTTSLLRFHWGLHAFTVGLDLGLSLSRELDTSAQLL